MRLWGTTTAINSCVLEILQNIEKILQCKVHNIPPNHMQQACLVGAESRAQSVLLGGSSTLCALRLALCCERSEPKRTTDILLVYLMVSRYLPTFTLSS